MGNINVDVKHKGSSIKSFVISYRREARICTGIGMIQVVIDANKGNTFDTWDEITLYENGALSGTYFINNIGDTEPDSTITIMAQDASKYLVDYFIPETYTIDYPSRAKDWIIAFLEEAGITDYEFTTDDTSPYLSNNTSLGLVSAYDQIMYLLQICGWYMTFTANNKCVIGKLNTDLGTPSEKLNNRDILDIRVVEHDKMFRNRVVVWGRGSGYLGAAVSAEAYKTTPWNYDGDDFRTIVIANSNIGSSGIAQQLASQALNYFDEITVEKHITAEDARELEIGDACSVRTRIWRGKGLVTTYGTSMTANDGLRSHIILDEKCPRLFAYFDFGDYVYIGTVDSGVYRKHIKYDETWYDFNGGDLVVPSGAGLGSGVGISDLFVRADIGATVTFSGAAYYCFVDDTVGSGGGNWHEVNLGNIDAGDEDSPITIVNDEIKARACTIDRSLNEVRFLLDTWSGENYKSYVEMYYNRFSSPYLFSGQVYSGIAPLGLFTYSGVSGSGDSTWVMNIVPSGVTVAAGEVGMYPITFSGITTGSGGYSVVGFDIENDGAFDYASVRVDKDPIFYMNTVFGGQDYITGVNGYTRNVVTHVLTSGVVVDTLDPQSVDCHNVGNMFSSRSSTSQKTVFLNNHTVNDTIPTYSGEYDFGVGMRGDTGFGSFNNNMQVDNITDYVSLMSVPSGTYIDDLVEVEDNYSLVDTIGVHETIRWEESGDNKIIVENYNFGASGWSFSNTIEITMPEFLDLPIGLQEMPSPIGDYIHTTGSGVYTFLTKQQTSFVPTTYRWLFVTSTSGGTVLVDYPPLDVATELEFIDNGNYYLTYGGGGDDFTGAGPGSVEDPRYLVTMDASTGEYEETVLFDGISEEMHDIGYAFYRIKPMPYKDSYQVLGYLFQRDPGNPISPLTINVHAITGLSGKGGFNTAPTYVFTDAGFLDAAEQTIFNYIQFTREWSAAWWEAKESHPTIGWLGDTILSIMNYGAHGVNIIQPPLTELLDLPSQTYSNPPFMEGSIPLATPIADESFDNLAVFTHSVSGIYLVQPPFLDIGLPVPINGHVVGARPYKKPESNKVKKYMVLRRSGEDFDIVTGGSAFPYRLEASHPSPLSVGGLYRFGFQTFYMSNSGVAQTRQLHPITGIFASGVDTSSGVGFDIVDDFRYTLFDSQSLVGSGTTLLYTTSGVIWNTQIDSFSTFTQYSGYTEAVASGVMIGSASMLETSNYAYPEQYVFLSTLAGEADFRFFQKNPSGVFYDCSLFSGYPNSEITIIRLEDMV